MLNLSDGVKKRDKLSHDVGGAYRVLEVDSESKTIVIQRGDVTERVSMNRVTRAPRTAPLAPSAPEHEFAATPEDLADKTSGPSWYFKSILDHRTLQDGSVEFKLDWEGHRPTWVGRPDVPEESVSRYFARLATARARERSRPVATVVECEPLPVIPRCDSGKIWFHRFEMGRIEYFIWYRGFRGTWVLRQRLERSVYDEYIASLPTLPP